MKITSPLKKAHWPWPKMDIREVAMQACCNKIYMPNIGFIPVEVEQLWQAELGDAANSKRLWINSLVSAHACLQYGIGIENESKKIISVGANLIKSYLNLYSSDEGVFKDAWKDEHAVANRLFVLTAYIHEICNLDSLASKESAKMIEDFISIETLFHHALIHAEWLSVEQHYVKNNHGVMMDIALAQFSVILGTLYKGLSERYSKISIKRLEMMLDQTFDTEGCCTENSPTYHFVNFSLFSTILNYINQYGLKINLKKWMERLEKARKVGNLLLRSNNTIPMVGDSEINLGTFFPEPENINHKNGLGFYPDAGFFVVQRSNMHLTFKAGGTAFSHRHIDDLSITLYVDGKDFIVDSGLYNYDVGDKMRRWFTSSRAHSGIYLDSMGNVLFKNFLSPREMSHFVAQAGDENDFAVKAVHNLTKNIPVSRSLYYKENLIKIEDQFECDSVQSWRIQFLLHPNVEVIKLKSNNSFLLKNDTVSIKIDFDDLCNISIEDSNYSPKFMEVVKSKSIVIKGVGQYLNALTHIHL